MTKAEIKERITEIRHWLHMHPETALEEYETSEYIAGIMEELGCQVTRGVGKTGGDQPALQIPKTRQIPRLWA